ncbi:hypothetical protein [Streptomyces sp. NPDC006996]|uniref:hypothetical protein n=1 Tax=Streptomyces sp. NPDC006996 TaxID=3156908 RepID=UPI0033C95D19
MQVPGPQRQSVVGLAQHDLSEQAPAVDVGHLARSRHTSVPSLEGYARLGVDAVARHIAQ